MAKGKRGRDKKSRKSRKKYLSAGDDTTDISSFVQRTNNNDDPPPVRTCRRCTHEHSGSDGAKDNANTCPGRAQSRYCYYFDDSTPIPKRRCGRCHKYGGDHAYECRVTKGEITEGHINMCEYYDKDGKKMG